jgi:hypothetical protein
VKRPQSGVSHLNFWQVTPRTPKSGCGHSSTSSSMPFPQCPQRVSESSDFLIEGACEANSAICHSLSRANPQSRVSYAGWAVTNVNADSVFLMAAGTGAFCPVGSSQPTGLRPNSVTATEHARIGGGQIKLVRRRLRVPAMKRQICGISVACRHGASRRSWRRHQRPADGMR